MKRIGDRYKCTNISTTLKKVSQIEESPMYR